MKKIKLLLFGLMLLVFTGCGVESNYDKEGNGSGNGGNDEQVEEVIELSSVNRKIIYTVSADISTKELNNTYKSIKNSLEADEWMDNENITSNMIILKIRVKSARLDAFVNSFSNYGEVGNYSKEAEDISLTYQNYSNRIASLEAERERLNELYEQASMYDMITINKRISEINLEIGTLNKELNKFDSLADYSVVNLRIYEQKIIKEPSFGGSIGKAFTGGWNAVVSLLKFLVIALSALVPFLVIFIPVGGVAYFIVKHNKKKNKSKTIDNSINKNNKDL